MLYIKFSTHKINNVCICKKNKAIFNGLIFYLKKFYNLIQRIVEY